MASDALENDAEARSQLAPVPRDFHHPYTPYAIQETFMSTVYQVLDEGKVGILESPTGTGKSLSLICGALTWLRDHKGREFEEGINWSPDDSDEPQWIVEQTKARKRREMLRRREDMEARLAKIRAKEKAQRQQYLRGESASKKRRPDSTQKVNIDQDDTEEQFVLDDYDSDDGKASSKAGGETGALSATTLALMEKLGMSISAPKDEEDEEEDEIKIFYCSRTHSQLTQFINELRRVKFPPTIQSEEKQTSDAPPVEDLKHLTLGSRRNLCINPSVTKLSSATAINERCLELQQPGTARDHKCAFLPNKDNQTLVNDFRDHTLATIRDIEDMGALGKELHICPYYASRSTIKPAEIVTLPYPLLLQKSAREALKVGLTGHVVIIDEAHNLMDAIAGIESVEISLKQLKRARAQLGGYLQKFKNRLKGKNRVYVAQVVRVIDSLAGYLESRLKLPKLDDVVDEKELLSGKGVDQINLFQLINYLHESKLARKVEGYAIHTCATTTGQVTKSNAPKADATTPVLHHVSSLLAALTHPSKEGRLFYSKSNGSPADTDADAISLRFLLLDPSSHFQEIVGSARAVILAGGTMSPMSDYTSHLFPYMPSSSITTLSCGHVIPKSNLVAWNLSSGPLGKGSEFEFTFKNRANESMIEELGRALLNVCTVVPDGVVVFFPSYSYLETISNFWARPAKSTGVSTQKSIWQRLEAKKGLFREKKEGSVDSVLEEYAKSIDTGKGGLLLSVVGGKMSEGINFSDRLGRCVVIVGLPFPNIMSAEWKAKIEYIETATAARLRTSEDSAGLNETEIMSQAKEQGRQFYENACMRAVNQSVGRAIRHREDYAAIVMIDKRFSNERIKSKLPGWIKEGMVPEAGDKTFGQLMGALSSFFRSKKRG